MPDPDLSDTIDVDALARLLASPAFTVDACRDRIARYVREGDGEAGRGIEAISHAFKAHAGDRLGELKPALVAALTYTRRGEFSPDVGYRVLFTFGHAIWHNHDSTRLFDANPFAIADVMAHLHPHAGGAIDQLARDLMAWVELGDPEARARLVPVVTRAGSFPLRTVGYTMEAGARLLEVMTLDLPDLEARLARLLANAEAQIDRTVHLRAIATILADHHPRDAPPHEFTRYANDWDRTTARATFELFWHLIRRHRALFERHVALFAGWSSKGDDTLRALGLVDDQAEIAQAGARGEPWRIMRAGRVVMTTTGESLTHLPRFTAAACPSEAAAIKTFATKLAAKRAGPGPKAPKTRSKS